MKLRTKTLVRAGVIAALYAALTYAAAAMNLAFGGIQFRFSEALTILPIFTPAAIPGLTFGCLLSNLASPYPLDMLFGTAATLLSAAATYALRGLRIRNVPVLALLPPVLINAVVVGAQIVLTMTEGFSAAAFWPFALQVGIGQLVVCYGLGLPLFFMLDRSELKQYLQ